MGLFDDLFSAFAPVATAADPAAPGQVASTVTSGGGIFSSITAFFATVTDGKMWRSFGWILLGIMIMTFGLNLWLHNPIGKGAGKLGGAAATAAVL
jgi:hypothetical protein